MITNVFIALVFQSLLLPPRTALENPAIVSNVPLKLQKDYGKLWPKFIAGKDDAKLVKDLDKLLKKEKTFDPGWIVQAYIDLYKGDDLAARQKFTQALTLSPNNRIALYYLAEIAFARSEFARASTLYAQLLKVDPTRPELETKRQRTLLLATDEVLQSVARAESDNRLADAEQYYRQALTMLPKEPSLHSRLADLLARQNRGEEAEAERKIAAGLIPARPGSVRTPATETSKIDTLEDLGRWGGEIDVFHQIRDAGAITREQLAILIVRYFPQLTEFRQTPQIVTDLQDSSALSEIQTVVGVGLMAPLPNHTFEPASPVTRADLASVLARLSRLLRLSPPRAPVDAVPDVTPTNVQYSDIQLVLGFDVMALQDSGSFNVSGQVSGAEAVRAAERLMRTFQQAQR